MKNMNTHSATNRAPKLQVYIDATIPSYFVAAPSREPKIAEWQRITRDFWQDLRFEFILSGSVVGEISFHEGGTPMISPHDPAKDIYKAKERLVALFGDLETYMDFMMKRQEKLIKQGVKFVDLPEVRVEPPKKSDD